LFDRDLQIDYWRNGCVELRPQLDWPGAFFVSSGICAADSMTRRPLE
jgi:hypothetical protein